MDLVVDYKNARKYTRTAHYDRYLMERKDVWHQIVVRHPGLEKHRRSELLKCIFDAVEAESLYLIDYKADKAEHSFLVKNCAAALKCLFAKQLQIPFTAGRHLSLTVYLNVAPYRSGQLTAEKMLQAAVDKCLAKMRQGILDLSRFAQRPEFESVMFTMNSGAVFQEVCQLVYGNDEYCRQVYGFNLSNNGMERVAALKLFANMQLKSLDLRNNEIRSAKSLCKDLGCIKADQLFLAGNPIVKHSAYPKCLQSILRNFKRLDSMEMEYMAPNYNPMNEVGAVRSGHLIRSINKMDIHQYRNSVEWHAFKVVDPEQCYSKDQLFDIILGCANSSLPPMYPCYYKFEDGAHAFLVRQCFVQLEYMIFQAKMFDLPLEQPFRLMIYMNAFKFKAGQIEPVQCIASALSTRCSHLEGLLDLEDFQSSQGLEHVRVDMNSPDFIKSLVKLFQKTQRFTCVSLRLGRNNLRHLSVFAFLPLVDALENLDLSNNNLPTLEAIQSIKLLQLKSLSLKGNPLCSAYGAPSSYRKAVKERFRGLQLLDDIDVNCEDNSSTKQNFLSDATLYHFVDEFVRRYFQTYDSHNRPMLIGLYHTRALFSMHCAYSKVCGSQRLQPYTALNSDILLLGSTNLLQGPKEIMAHLAGLPRVAHDTTALTIDTVSMANFGVQITVTGCFVDEGNALSNQMVMAFARTFVLKPVQQSVGLLGGSKRYQITNDHLNVFDPTAEQLAAFRSDVVRRRRLRLGAITEADLKVQMAIFQEITRLKLLWCSTFLEQAKWDMAVALRLFTISSNTGSIPENAYIP